MFRRNDDHDDDEFEDDDLDEEQKEEEGDDDDDDDDDDEAEVERQFREHRARVRACANLDDLRQMRANLRHAVSAGTVQGASRIRAKDLIELIDDRITDVRAKQIADRRW
jgi:hypothetical protein